MKKVLLLSMPFGALERQALGLSNFKARFDAEGISCDVRYLTFSFADLIGAEEYCWVSIELPHTAFVGEWIFTQCLYGANTRSQALYIRSVLRGTWCFDNQSLNRIFRIQEMAPRFIEHCLKTIPWDDYALVGFTSTFEQNIASLALARRVKAEHPKVKIVFGGANWEGEMGLQLHRLFPFVDYAFTGEADNSFPTMSKLTLEGCLNGNALKTIPGLIYRSGGKTVLGRAPEPVRDLDDLPIPDYSDFFRDFDRSSASTFVLPTLLFESSRGCWWGQKNRCMFCGLNGATMAYRSKSSQRALKEIKYLSTNWKMEQIQAVDNVIPMNYFKDLFPAMAKMENPVRLFYEVRANLNREHLKTLYSAGVYNVQPGIESFNSHILKLMRKGTTALQNIQFLKWCKEYGVRADYNILYGFPGETDDDYRQLFSLLKVVRFLNPPTACGPIRMDRFSPYFEEAEKYGFFNIRPILPYYYLYPFEEKSVSKIAYYFDYDLKPGTKAVDWSSELLRWMEDWKKNPDPGTLQSFERPDGTLALLDTRPQAIRSSIILKGIDRFVYEYCNSVRTLDSICDYLTKKFPNANLRKIAIQSFLNALVSHGYMLNDGSDYLSLALCMQSTNTDPNVAAQSFKTQKICADSATN